ncbi:tail fiber domain-containing protein [Huaxiibacter chinensis]|uniref:tail fiber domain-containing protein n=1 Tax=Huaxiibacter chinensis TaxID=2899785 RepID=UPI003D313D64
MLYNTGTIAINGNIATGTGTNWTAPASQVRAGQTIIVMSNPVQMFQISSVNSATSLTVTPAASPALSGQKYGILVSDIISVDGLAQAMSQLINEYDENIGAWETFATTSANQSITVTINGVSVSIPSIGKLLQKGTNGALPVNQGGTGATTKEDARTNLGLGTSSTKDTGVTGNVVPLLDADGVTFSQRLSVGGGNYSSQLRLISNTDGYGQMEIYSSGGTVRCRLAYINSNDLYYYKYVGGSYSFGVMFPQSGGTLALTGTSDIRFKDDVEDIDPIVSLDNINRMRPVSFVFKADESRTVRRGVIAQEIMDIDPQYVHLNIDRNPETQEDTERYSLDNNALLLDALLAIQALSRKIKLLESES